MWQIPWKNYPLWVSKTYVSIAITYLLCKYHLYCSRKVVYNSAIYIIHVLEMKIAIPTHDDA